MKAWSSPRRSTSTTGTPACFLNSNSIRGSLQVAPPSLERIEAQCLPDAMYRMQSSPPGSVTMAFPGGDAWSNTGGSAPKVCDPKQISNRPVTKII